MFSIVLYGVLLTAGVLLWNVASNTGTVDNVERWFTQFGWESYELKGGEIFHNAWIAGLFGVVGLTGLGGAERDVVQPDQRHGRRRARHRARRGGRRAHDLAERSVRRPPPARRAPPVAEFDLDGDLDVPAERGALDAGAGVEHPEARLRNRQRDR